MNDSFTNAERAEVLTQALPYIRKFNGQIIVIKYGGNAMVDEKLKQQVMHDIVLLWLVGIKVVLVHGGGPDITDLMAKLGKEPEFVDGLRVTDKETVEIAQMVLAGKINKSLVALLEKCGGNAMGISGMDGKLIQAKPKNDKLGYVGEITKINKQPIMDLLEKGYIPVISSLGYDDDGNIYNINGDTVAAWIASAIGARRMFMMTDIAGILRDPKDHSTLIRRVSVTEAQELMKEKVVTGGMIPKVQCCIDAINGGVNKVVVMDGRIPHSILMELLTDEGAGTMIAMDNLDD